MFYARACSLNTVNGVSVVVSVNAPPRPKTTTPLTTRDTPYAIDFIDSIDGIDGIDGIATIDANLHRSPELTQNIGRHP